jgi:methylenetetrahydrofolate reductase (NADPH)
MTKIKDLLKNNTPIFSFEFFPPKDELGAVEFGVHVGRLIQLKPSFVSVTYGAGGSTQDKTFGIVDLLQTKMGLTTMAHYTCVNASKQKVANDINSLYEMGIKNLMLLRGDPPKGADVFVPHKEGYQYASELIADIAQTNKFSIGAAAYPEKHVEAKTIEDDIQNLKKKVESGTDFLVTQMFFNNDVYYEFIEKTDKAQINCPMIPGIIPVTNFTQIKRFLDLSNASMPKDFMSRLEKNKNNPEAVYKIGIEHAVKQCKDLLSNGAPGIHFYTLNKSRAAIDIYEAIKPG